MTSDVSCETHVARQVWEGAADETYRREQSHWRGIGRWEDDDRWRAIGRSTVASFDLTHRYLGSPISMAGRRRTFLEWGPGGGTNLLALAPIAERYYGVDISRSNLDEAERMIREEGYDDVFRPVLVRDDPSEILAHVDSPIELFVSTAVFQHFPSKSYGRSVLEVIHEVTAPHALGVVQIRYDNDDPRFRPIGSLDEYRERHITANSYKIDEFWALANETGFDVLFVRSINVQINYATFHLRRR
ncbi:methyltransferase domain-containing protein [Ilumatobacter sp.]|uniref:methyltransferase domain-containing protein n=1 Tax=Ilumatobacter sp. TaxID=1967498 RepID=UPI003B524D51